MKSWAETNVGQMRELNEDNYFIKQTHTKDNAPVGIFIVADGVGGQDAGEVASDLVSKYVGNEIEKQLNQITGLTVDSASLLLSESIKNGNNELITQFKGKTRKRPMTTINACILWNDCGVFANVGDSRTYILDGGFKQITKDHSFVQQLVDAGQLTPEMAAHHPQRNQITRAVGMGQNISVDIFTMESGLDSATILLCSDGLYSMVPDKDIQEILSTYPSPEIACKQLIQNANDAGGNDNITVIVIKNEMKKSQSPSKIPDTVLEFSDEQPVVQPPQLQTEVPVTVQPAPIYYSVEPTPPQPQENAYMPIETEVEMKKGSRLYTALTIAIIVGLAISISILIMAAISYGPLVSALHIKISQLIYIKIASGGISGGLIIALIGIIIYHRRKK